MPSRRERGLLRQRGRVTVHGRGGRRRGVRTAHGARCSGGRPTPRAVGARPATRRPAAALSRRWGRLHTNRPMWLTLTVALPVASRVSVKLRQRYWNVHTFAIINIFIIFLYVLLMSYNRIFLTYMINFFVFILSIFAMVILKVLLYSTPLKNSELKILNLIIQ